MDFKEAEKLEDIRNNVVHSPLVQIPGDWIIPDLLRKNKRAGRLIERLIALNKANGEPETEHQIKTFSMNSDGAEMLLWRSGILPRQLVLL